MHFDTASVAARPISEDAEYQGVRVHCVGRLGQARERLQIDVSFGHEITPAVQIVPFPTLLGGDSFDLPGYPIETVVSEKFEAMVKLSVQNSRMKDFYDLFRLATTRDFDGASLRRALERTFRRRGTPLNAESAVFSGEFATDRERQAQWAGFLRRTKIQDAPQLFSETMEGIVQFVLPVYRSACDAGPLPGRWSHTGRRWARA
jgi:hypothetical protein